MESGRMGVGQRKWDGERVGVRRCPRKREAGGS